MSPNIDASPAGGASSLRRRVWARARRPSGLLESTRWLFVGMVLLSYVLTVPSVVLRSGGWLLALVAAVTVELTVSWCTGYRRGGISWPTDLADTVSILIFAAVAPEPPAVFGFLFAALWFRSLYGSLARGVVRAGLYVAATAASLALWPLLPGHVGTAAVAPVATILPTLFLIVVMGQSMLRTMADAERADQIGAVHVALGSALAGVTDAVEIGDIAWTALHGICAAAPGLRIVKVVGQATGIGVDGSAGAWVALPQTLSPAVLPLLDGVAAQMVHGCDPLDTAAGAICVWTSVSMPDGQKADGPSWMLLGRPHAVPIEAVVAVGSLVNQMTLALRNSAVHRTLRERAALDRLTGLANRDTFTDAVAGALADETVVQSTVLFVDLDDFKAVNDVFGHAGGDEVLREVGNRLRWTTRPEDTCSRLGGDDFAVLLRGMAAAGAAEVGQRIVAAVGAPVTLDAGHTQVSASVGVATALAGGDVEELLQQADVAMYAAKAFGKNRVQVFDPGLAHGESPHVAFQAELAGAATNGELVVYYQPVLSLPDLRCTAVEALVRWRHPTRGLLAPGSFIEIAERTGAIRSLGDFVLQRACADAAVWRVAYPGSSLAIQVNVSALQLDDPGFLDSVLACLRTHDMSAERLVLEITESVVLSSPSAIGQVNALAARGVGIAIDDFGTGYSALTTLRSLPVRIVKIDQSFVAGSLLNHEDRAVTSAVVNMAAQMGIQTIAEGVETLEQQQFLEGVGADSVQGYLYFRPAPAAQFGAWLGANLAGQAPAEDRTAVVVPFAPRRSA